jgi:hypothetical protein
MASGRGEQDRGRVQIEEDRRGRREEHAEREQGPGSAAAQCGQAEGEHVEQLGFGVQPGEYDDRAEEHQQGQDPGDARARVVRRQQSRGDGRPSEHEQGDGDPVEDRQPPPQWRARRLGRGVGNAFVGLQLRRWPTVGHLARKRNLDTNVEEVLYLA